MAEATPERSLLIRPAVAADDLALGELLVAAYLAGYARRLPEVVLPAERLAELRAVAHKRSIASVLVAELAGRIVGTVALFAPGAESSQAWLPNAADLRHLATHPSVHGQGHSAALLDAAERLARESWEVDAVCLHVRRGNQGVARLYQARGYQRDPAGDLELPLVSLLAFALSFR